MDQSQRLEVDLAQEILGKIMNMFTDVCSDSCILDWRPKRWYGKDLNGLYGVR